MPIKRLEAEGRRGNNLASCSPVACILAVAAGDVFTVKDVVHVDADGRARQTEARQIVFHGRIRQGITRDVKGLIGFRRR